MCGEKRGRWRYVLGLWVCLGGRFIVRTGMDSLFMRGLLCDEFGKTIACRGTCEGVKFNVNGSQETAERMELGATWTNRSNVSTIHNSSTV